MKEVKRCEYFPEALYVVLSFCKGRIINKVYQKLFNKLLKFLYFSLVCFSLSWSLSSVYFVCCCLFFGH